VVAIHTDPVEFSQTMTIKIWLIEPYYTGSHQAWATGYQANSLHDVRLLTLPGRFWKWRMQGGAVTLARQTQALDDLPDLILASDMLNLPVFLALAGARLAPVPVALYFHENQLTYPLQPGEKRDLHYGFVNFVSALRADAILFNSAYHLRSFFDELPRLLKHFPDYNELWAVDALRAKSQVLPLGLDLASFEAHRPERASTGRPLILWNHRWEYDKDPETFFRAIYALTGEAGGTGGLDFGLILLGESFRNWPAEFLEARQRLADHIVHFGYAEDEATYARLLWQADLVVSTARHEFFGAAVVEACYCGCFPILPRRLSYPELIPAAYHDDCLYDGFDGLLYRLRHALQHVGATREFSLQHHVAGFDWRQMAVRYDNLFKDVVVGRAAGTCWPGARTCR
jgi:glycosyltransferase involved in cell wall biosynthesis